MTTENGTGADALTEAARFVAAQPGGSDILRSRHRPRRDGTCGGCGETQRITWPCVLVAIATLADAGPPPPR